MDEIKLIEVGGLSRLSGRDQHGRHWDQCWSDFLATSTGLLRCSMCGNLIPSHASGWMCCESGEVRCDKHITY